ncbi:MAG: cobyrinate a,c-diamide synthase, partial [Anaerotignaceae bacterium]
MNINRIMIVGTNSGCGKTTITCGILKALKNRKLKVASFKCGPDYIDPMFHKQIIGARSANIDLFLCKEKNAKYLFAKNAKNCDISVVEGVMGFYDGLGGNTSTYSSWDISQRLDIPAILVVDCKGMSMSVVATIKGFIGLYPNNIKGVILNNVSKHMFPLYQEIIENNTHIKVVGYLPKDKDFTIKSRHLGLVTAGEIKDLNNTVDALGKAVEETINLNLLIKIANESKPFKCETLKIKKITEVNIAVAKDECFSFYYGDSLELLKKMGAKLIPFSPIYSSRLPKNISGIIIGGGYPELYLDKFSTNIMEEIRALHKKNIPIFAECGGFMYLGKEIDGHKTVGIIDMVCTMTNKLQNFGYVELKATKDNLLLDEGETM